MCECEYCGEVIKEGDRKIEVDGNFYHKKCAGEIGYTDEVLEYDQSLIPHRIGDDEDLEEKDPDDTLDLDLVY